MKIFILECYKLLRQRILICLLALLLTVTAVYAIMNNLPSDNINKEQESYFETYHVFITGMQSRADRQGNFSVFSDNSDFAKRNIEQTPKDFADLHDIVLVKGDYTGIETGTSDLLTDIFVLSMVFIICIFLFSTEREKNLLILVKSTKNGHAASAAARLAVLLTGTFVCCLLFYGIRLIIIFSICGTPPLDAPIQSSGMFMNCSLRINVLQYILLWFGTKVLIMSAIGCLFSAVFLLLKSSGTICFVCMGIIAAEYGLFALISESSTLCNFHFINLFAFLDTKEIISNYLNLNILEYPVNRITVFISVCAVLTVFSMTVSVIAFSLGSQIKKESLFSKLSASFRKRISHFGSVNLFAAEMYKLLIEQKGFAVLLVLLCIGINGSSQTWHDSFSSVSDATLYSYISTLEGRFDEQKEQFIEKEGIYYDKLKAEYKELSSTESLTLEQEQRMYSLEFTLKYQKQGFERLIKHIDYLREKQKESGGDIYIINDIQYEHLLMNNKTDTLSVLLGLGALIISLSGTFAFEHKRQMTALLRSAKNGKGKLFFTKLLSAVLTAGIIYTLIYAPLIIAYIRQYGNVILKAPVYSLPDFSDAPSSMTIFGMLVLQYMFRLLLFISAAIIAAALSELTENSFLTITEASLLFILPSVMLCSFGLGIVIGIGSGYLWLIVIIGSALCILSLVTALSAARKFTGRSVLKGITERRKYHGAKA